MAEEKPSPPKKPEPLPGAPTPHNHPGLLWKGKRSDELDVPPRLPVSPSPSSD